MSKRSEILSGARRPKQRGWQQTAGLALLCSVLGGGTVYYLTGGFNGGDRGDPLETSQPSSFQRNQGQNGPAVPQIEDEPSAPEQTIDTAEIDRLRAKNERLAQQVADEKAEEEERRRLFEERLDEIETQNSEKLAQLEADFAAREAEMSAEQAALLAEQQAEADRRARLDEERQRQAELLRQRMEAPPVLGSSTNQDYNDGTVGSERLAMSGDREFLINNAAATETRRATVTANPSNTVGQGTIIEAALEVAINSDLEGQVSAIVSRDVWSMDMTRVLVPRGSKMFGSYSSTIGQTQKRVLVAWARLTTTDGQSVSLQAFGSDRLGRSGMVSEVNTHFASRFASAAAVSMISVLPLLAADESGDDDSKSSDVAENVGSDLSSAVGDVMKGYLGRKPTILVHQGSNVSIRVDSDLEFY